MQVQDPQFKFRKMLAGTWKSSDASCTAVLDIHSSLEISFANAKLSCSYGVVETGPAFESNSMMGFAFLNYKRHPGEELKIQMNNTDLSDGSSTLYTVSCLWYGEEKLNLELTAPNGQITDLVLIREVTEASGYVCECGYAGPFGKFCPNCGKAVEKEYTCQCGYRSKGAKFCPNCGHPIEQTASDPEQEKETASKPEVPEPEEKLGWKCPQCGALDQIDKCLTCGAKIEPVMLLGISSYMSTNPPVNTYTNVYEYSDTQLLLDCNGKRRLISADVIEPAMEIIRKNKLDDPDFKDPSAMGIMGGSVCIGFKIGDRFMKASMQEKGFAVTNAQNELMGLFNKA